MVDGNIKRVYARLFRLTEAVNTSAGEKAVWAVAELVWVAEHLAVDAISAGASGGADVEKAQKALDAAATEEKPDKRIVVVTVEASQGLILQEIVTIPREPVSE